MRKTTACNYCSKIFNFDERPSRPSRTKYCSIACQRKGRSIFKWSNLSEDEILLKLTEEFNKKTVKNEKACWDWSGSLKVGYGVMKCKKRFIKTHRFSWKINFGPIPEGMYVCHKCDNRKCNNPEHLFLGTHEDNMKDMINKNRQRGAVGESNAKAIINKEKALEIKKMLSNGMTTIQIAKDLNISRAIVFGIKHKKNWSHI